MKNFEESLRRLDAPDLQVATFRQKLRRDLSIARSELSLRRWRRACLASGGLSVVLAVALAALVTAPAAEVPRAGLSGESATLSPAAAVRLIDGELSVDNDRVFVEAYYARQGHAVRVQSVDDERVVAIREFTMSDGQQMVVYTELGEGRSNRSGTPLGESLTLLASRPPTTF